MADSLNATFFAFRKRDRGGVLIGATLTYIVIAFGVMGLFAYFNWQAFLDYFQWAVTMSQSVGAADPNDPNAVAAAMTPPASVMGLIPAYFLFMFFTYFLLAAYEAACLRWMIRGETKGLFGLALDADTLRVYFGYWIWFFLFLTIYIVLWVVLAGVFVGIAMSAGSGADPAAAMGPSVLIAVLVTLAVILGLIYFGVRYAPAAATSIAKKRFAFFDAWTVTKGRFWALFGSYLLLFLMYFVGIIIVSVVVGVITGVNAVSAVQASDPQSPDQALAMFASPGVWVPIAICYGLMIIGVFVFYVALFGINARAAVAALEEGKIQATG